MILAPAPRAQASHASLATTRVSIGALALGSPQGNSPSGYSDISADGRYVAFASQASNLVGGDGNGTWDVFVHDRTTHDTELVSVTPAGTSGNGGSEHPDISADGRYVAFGSYATDLVPGDTGGQLNVFVYDRTADQMELITRLPEGLPANGGSDDQSISADGRYVAFTSSATNLLVGSDSNGWADVFVHDRDTDTTERVSLSSTGEQAEHGAEGASISADGRRVVFQTSSVQMVPEDESPNPDVYLRDLVAGTTTRVTTGTMAGSGYLPVISGDGQNVTFVSGNQVWMKHLQTGAFERVSVPDPETGQTEPNGQSPFEAAPSADGRFVAFMSYATNLVPQATNGGYEVYFRDTLARTTVLVSVSSAGNPAGYPSPPGGSSTPAITPDARFVSFTSGANNLDDERPDTNGWDDVFVHDWQGSLPDAPSTQPAISSDGRYVAFTSSATNLVTGDTNRDTNSRPDVFVTDTLSNENLMVSYDYEEDQQSDGDSGAPAISADGQYVAYHSDATTLVGGDSNTARDVFLFDLATGKTTRVSLKGASQQGNGNSTDPSISADGRYVAFASSASNLVSKDTNGQPDVFLRDVSAQTTTRLSVTSSGKQATGASTQPAMSGDGRYVAFTSTAPNLVPGGVDTNEAADVFVHELATGTTTRVSVRTSGAQVNGASSGAAITSDGRYVAFQSLSPDFSADDANGTWDVIVRDRTGGSSTLISKPIGENAVGDAASDAPTISGSGQWVAFRSDATNFWPGGDPNGVSDIYEYDAVAGSLSRISVGPGEVWSNGVSEDPAISTDGEFVAYTSAGTNLDSGWDSGTLDIFTHEWADEGRTHCKTKRRTRTLEIPWPFALDSPNPGGDDWDPRCQPSSEGALGEDPDPTRTEAQSYDIHYTGILPLEDRFSPAEHPPPDGYTDADTSTVYLRWGYTLRKLDGRWGGWGYRKIAALHGWGAEVKAQVAAALQTSPVDSPYGGGWTYLYRYPGSGVTCERVVVVQYWKRGFEKAKGYPAPGIITTYAGPEV